VQARQQLNVCIALQLALKDGLQWILHIDIDELFYVTPPTTLKDHFAWLMANGIGQITYLNYEVLRLISYGRLVSKESSLLSGSPRT